MIEAVGSPATFELAIAHGAQGGRILVFGAASPGVEAGVKPFDIFAKELTILGTVRNPYTHGRARSVLPHIPFSKLDIHKFDLDEVHSAIEAQQQGVAEGRGLSLKVQVGDLMIANDRPLTLIAGPSLCAGKPTSRY